MLKAPSLQTGYTLVFSGDPALNLPAIPAALPSDASAEQVAERDAVIADRQNQLRVARETGRWDKLCIAGERPTLFHLKPLSGSTYTWLASEADRRELRPAETMELALRLALDSIENLGAIKVSFEKSEDGQRLVKRSVIDDLYAIGIDAGDAELGRAVVQELGSCVLVRAQEPLSPKS